jgi:predicted nicotinamide N-methyase
LKIEAPLERERLKLRRRVEQRFAWHWAPQRVAGHAWKIATASDPEGMLIEACRRQDAGEVGVIDPFWAAVWRAAAGLDRFLDRYDLAGTRVLEVGCGTGRAGLAAALRGAHVTLTDGVSDPLLLVQMTVADVRPPCTVRRLRFGLDRINAPPFPLILGSDVTYLRGLWSELDVCLRQHLAVDGEVLLSDPYRLIANEFRDWIQGHGWAYREFQIDLEDDAEHPIRIMRLRRT